MHVTEFFFPISAPQMSWDQPVDSDVVGPVILWESKGPPPPMLTLPQVNSRPYQSIY